jgi:hypothetical protein
MNSRNTDDDGQLRESVGDGAELARAVHISLSGLDLEHPASFRPAALATADFDWQAWLRECFAEDLGPAFVEIFLAAGRMQVSELMKTDRWLEGADSRVAGAALLDRLVGAKGARVAERVRSIIEESGTGEGPHFVTAFAVECAEFHLPLRPALVSYLYGEWRCGMAGIGERGDLDGFAASGGAVICEVLGKVLSKGAGDFLNAAGL